MLSRLSTICVGINRDNGLLEAYSLDRYSSSFLAESSSLFKMVSSAKLLPTRLQVVSHPVILQANYNQIMAVLLVRPIAVLMIRYARVADQAKFPAKNSPGHRNTCFFVNGLIRRSGFHLSKVANFKAFLILHLSDFTLNETPKLLAEPINCLWSTCIFNDCFKKVISLSWGFMENALQYLLVSQHRRYRLLGSSK